MQWFTTAPYCQLPTKARALGSCSVRFLVDTVLRRLAKFFSRLFRRSCVHRQVFSTSSVWLRKFNGPSWIILWCRPRNISFLGNGLPVQQFSSSEWLTRSVFRSLQLRRNAFHDVQLKPKTRFEPSRKLLRFYERRSNS